LVGAIDNYNNTNNTTIYLLDFYNIINNFAKNSDWTIVPCYYGDVTSNTGFHTRFRTRTIDEDNTYKSKMTEYINNNENIPSDFDKLFFNTRCPEANRLN